MKRILVCVDGFHTGGVTSVVKAIFENIDKNKFSMDFAAFHKTDSDFEKKIIKSGSRIYYLDYPKLNTVPYFNYSFQEKSFVRQAISVINDVNYDCIHIHSHANLFLLFAKKKKIPQIIMHFHEAVADFGENVYKSKLTNAVWKKRQKLYNGIPTVKAGDSMRACKVKYGDAVETDSKASVIHPPVDTEKFNPAKYAPDAIREQYKVNTNEFNMIHVGRLNPVKNQAFLIDVLAEMNKIKPTNLYLVGDGSLKDELSEYAREKKVEEKFKILPPDTTPGLYLSMDCSLLPSFSEAFGMVAVESQFMGVPCFASTNVPKDVNVGMCSFLPLDTGARAWANTIFNFDCKKAKLDTELKDMFTIDAIIKKVVDIYDKNN